MSWLKKSKEGLRTPQRKRELPDGLWTKCEDCGEILYQKELERNLWTCTKCSYHFRISARTYLKILLDEESFVERFSEIVSTDPLKLCDTKRYAARLRKASEVTCLREAILVRSSAMDGSIHITHVTDIS